MRKSEPSRMLMPINEEERKRVHLALGDSLITSRIRQINLKVIHLACGFLVGVLSILLIWNTSGIGRQSAVVLTIFNFFFVITTFALDGSLLIKLSMLLVGNVTFLMLNRILSYFLDSAVGAQSSILTVFLSSLVNLVWIVSFWSLSLTILSKSKKSK